MRIATSVLVTILILPAWTALAEAAPCHKPVLAQLDFLEGEWTVEARSRLSANPVTWEETKASSRFETMLLDCAVLERFVSTRRGKPFELLRLLTGRPQGAGLQLSLSDSEHGPLYTFESSTEAPLVFVTRIVASNGPVVLRQRFSEVTRDRFVLTSERSGDDGATWDVTGRGEYRRRAHTSSPR
jgi:hypothetical protein